MRDAKPAVLFFDDFSAGLGKWQPNWLGADDHTVTPPINGAELSSYDPANVSIHTNSKGVNFVRLALEARKSVAANGKVYDYASGCITTRRTFTFQPPARVEAHVWLAGDVEIANWPAFWADGVGQWPTDGELDVIEGIGGRAQYHFHSPSGGPGGSGALAPRPKAIGWHHVAADWVGDAVTFEYDGVKYGQVSAGGTDGPMFLICNLAASTQISPPVVAPSEMRIRSVKVTRLGP